MSDSPAAVLVDPISGNTIGVIDDAGTKRIAVDANVSSATLATEATLLTKATETTLLTRATEATLLAVNSVLNTINVKTTLTQTILNTLATQATLAAVKTAIDTLNTKDFATQTTLLNVATEVTLAAVKTVLDSINAKDFATETTLLTVATEATLEAVSASLTTLASLDFATETTLNDARNVLYSINGAVSTEATLQSIATILTALGLTDFATETTLATRASETTLAAVKAVLDGIATTDFSTETTLATRLADTTFTTRINTLGQKTMAASTPVVIASNQSDLPVTGTVTADIGTTNGLALDATLTGGTAKSINRGGVKGATTAADVTSTAEGADHQALDIQIYHGGAAVNPTAIRALTNADVISTELTKWIGSTAPTVGSKTSANSIPVVIASDQAPIAITGSITASNPSVGTTNSAVPAAATQIGGTDGTNLQSVKVFDGDSGVSTEYILGTLLRQSNNGGSVEVGTAAHPLRTDTTGTTTQPVSATALPLPTGAATETTVATLLADGTFTGRINTQGQKAMAASTPVVLASDQTAIPVSGTVTADIGTTNGLALDATLTGGTAKSINRGGVKGATTAADVTSTAEGADHQALDIQIYHGGAAVNPTAIRALTNADVISTELTKWIGSTAPTVGSKTSANSIPVVIASDQGVFTVTANVGTTNGLALDATLTGGTAKSINRGGVKGATTAADVTSTAEGADHQALDIQIYHGGAAVNPTAIRALTNADVISTELTKWIGSTAPTVGSKTSANSIPVVIASDQGAVAVTAAQGTPAAIANSWPTKISDGTYTAKVLPNGQLVTNKDPVQVFVDAFDGAALDTVNWNAFVGSGGGGVAGAVTGAGALDMESGTTIGAMGYIRSATTFGIKDPGLLRICHAVYATVPTRVWMFWGLGTPATGTAAASSKASPVNSLSDGIGWEIGTDGKLLTVFWSVNGGRTIITDLSSSGTNTQPSGGGYHNFEIYTNAAVTYWFIDGVLVSSASWLGAIVPSFQNLPLIQVTIVGNPAPGASQGLIIDAAAVGDTTGSSSTIGDGTYAWRKAAVKAASTAAATTDTALVVAVSPNNVISANPKSSTGTLSNVASNASSVTLLAANTSRVGATIWNDSTQVLYVKFGTTASTTSATIRMAASTATQTSYYEVPFGYTGRIDGIWASANGFARITEIT